MTYVLITGEPLNYNYEVIDRKPFPDKRFDLSSIWADVQAQRPLKVRDAEGNEAWMIFQPGTVGAVSEQGA